jgi:hypothetical protein
LGQGVAGKLEVVVTVEIEGVQVVHAAFDIDQVHEKQN